MFELSRRAVRSSILAGSHPTILSFLPQVSAGVPASVNTGAATPLSAYYANLAAAQADYPHVTALTETVTWAAAQAMVNAVGAARKGECVITAGAWHLGGRALRVPDGVSLELAGAELIGSGQEVVFTEQSGTAWKALVTLGERSRLHGKRESSIIRLANGAVANWAVLADHSDYVTVEGVTVEGNDALVAGNSCGGICIVSSAHGTVEGVTVNNCYGAGFPAIFFARDGNDWFKVVRARIKRSGVPGSARGADAIYAGQGEGGEVSGCTVEGAGDTGVVGEGTVSMTIYGCRFIRCAQGASIGSSSTRAGSNNIIQGCTMEGGGGSLEAIGANIAAFRIARLKDAQGNPFPTPVNNLIQGCVVKDVNITHGFWMEGASNWTLSDCKVENLDVNGGYHGVFLQDCRDGTISNCTIREVGGAGIWMERIDQLDVVNTRIKDTCRYNTYAGGIYLSGAHVQGLSVIGGRIYDTGDVQEKAIADVNVVDQVVTVTTSSAHGWTTNDHVTFADLVLAGSAFADGSYAITVTSATTFTVNAVTGVTTEGANPKATRNQKKQLWGITRGDCQNVSHFMAEKMSYWDGYRDKGAGRRGNTDVASVSDVGSEGVGHHWRRGGDFRLDNQYALRSHTVEAGTPVKLIGLQPGTDRTRIWAVDGYIDLLPQTEEQVFVRIDGSGLTAFNGVRTEIVSPQENVPVIRFMRYDKEGTPWAEVTANGLNVRGVGYVWPTTYPPNTPAFLKCAGTAGGPLSWVPQDQVPAAWAALLGALTNNQPIPAKRVSGEVFPLLVVDAADEVHLRMADAAGGVRIVSVDGAHTLFAVDEDRAYADVPIVLKNNQAVQSIDTGSSYRKLLVLTNENRTRILAAGANGVQVTNAGETEEWLHVNGDAVTMRGYLKAAGVHFAAGTVAPEGAVVAPVGSLYVRKDNGTVYRKASGAEATGWVQVDATYGLLLVAGALTRLLAGTGGFQVTNAAQDEQWLLVEQLLATVRGGLALAGGATHVVAGTGAPTSSLPLGSLYLQYDEGGRLWRKQSGGWTEVAFPGANVANGYAALDGNARIAEAQLPTTAELTTRKNAANGYAGLDASSKLALSQVPSGVELTANKNAANGYAGLDASSKLASSQMPSGVELTANKNAANGYAGLDASSKLASSQMPSGVELTANKNAANGYAGLDANGRAAAAQMPAGPAGTFLRGNGTGSASSMSNIQASDLPSSPDFTQVSCAGAKVLGARGSAVTKPTGGSVIDVEARAAVSALIDRLNATTGHGLIA